MDFQLSPPKIRFLANLLTNLAATWIAVIAISPNFVDVTNLKVVLNLIYSIVSAIIYSVMAITLEEKLDEQ